MVLEGPPEESQAPAEHWPMVRRECCPRRFSLPLLLSARTDKALYDLAERYAAFLRAEPPAWPDVCYTAAVHREHHDCRLAVAAASQEQAISLLEGFLQASFNRASLPAEDRLVAGQRSLSCSAISRRLRT